MDSRRDAGTGKVSTRRRRYAQIEWLCDAGEAGDGTLKGKNDYKIRCMDAAACV